MRTHTTERLGSLHESLKDENGSIISHTFGGEILSTVQCLTCKKVLVSIIPSYFEVF
jgi:hypothetical protein